MNNLYQTLTTLNSIKNDGTTSIKEFNDAINHAIVILETVESFLENRQKNNCSSACSPLVAIAEVE